MFPHPSRPLSKRFAYTMAAAVSAAALLMGTATPVQAQEQAPPQDNVLAVISSLLPPEFQSGVMLSLGVPVIGSSMLSSYVLNIPQCGLHDTRGC